jgi:HAE1 family hydrophobic/amphiphilic exporter-1
MTFSEISIQRPVFTWMMTLALIVFGVLGYQRLGLDQYPTMEFPVLTVTATLEGANPEGMEEDVTDVLEENLNTIGGVRAIKSTTFQGAAQIVIEFDLGTDLDVAAQNVRDKIDRARRDLPEGVETPVVGSFDPNEQPVLWIPLLTTRSLAETSEYVDRQIKPQLETIDGVAGVAVFGERKRSIRIWLNGDQLYARGLSASDVSSAMRREHVEIPAGSIESSRLNYSVKTDAEFRSLHDLRNLVIAHVGGAPILLSDVARVEDGVEDIKTEGHYNGAQTVGMGIRKQSGSNTVAIVNEVMRRLDEIRDVLPSGITIGDPEGFIDFSKGVREAVAEAKFALVFGALLAVLTVFVFLRRTRPTLIVAAAIPISLIATFGLVWMFGFTLNTMTLLGLTLAVGVVIDDAIVVLENIERHREQGESPYEAAAKGTREIAFAATAATISVAAVFLPVVFVDGLVGSFLGEFGVTVAGSVLISLFVALTLTPMLAARMPAPKERAHGSIYHKLEVGLTSLEEGYKSVLNWTLDHRWATIGLTIASIGLAFFFGSKLKAEFFPPTDEGIFFAMLEAAPGTSLDATLEYLARDEKWMLDQPELAGMFSGAGTTGGGSIAGTHQGMIFGSLVSRKERERSVFDVIRAARESLSNVPGRKIRIMNPGEMMRGGSGGGFELLIRGNLPLAELDRVSDLMIQRLEAQGGFVDIDKSLKLGLPELRVIPDRQKAGALGVDARTVASAIQMMVGGKDVGVFKEGGSRYDIRMRLDEEFRNDPDTIGSIYVRSSTGEVIELRNLVSVKSSAAASAITRTGRQRSVAISANLLDKPLGQAMEEAIEIGANILPDGVTLGLDGAAKTMAEGMSQFGVALLLAILVIYMVLAAQFESLVHPLTVMLALPLSMVGALGALLLTGNTLNLFSMIGIILLFGLVTKNSILLVDYANQLRERGMGKVEAMRTAAPVRMRPILMTAISMIFGVLPAAMGLGPGSETRAPMAIATAAGMMSSTILTLIVVPLFYLIFDDAAEAVKRGFRRIVGGSAAAPAPGPDALAQMRSK